MIKNTLNKKVIVSLIIGLFMFVVSFFMLAGNVGGMKSLGIAGYFPVQLHKT